MFFRTLHSLNNPEKYKKIQHFFSTKTLIAQQLSSDTEDWTNAAENPALDHRNKLHF